MDLQASACFGTGRDSWVEAIIGVDVEVANDVETPADNATVVVVGSEFGKSTQAIADRERVSAATCPSLTVAATQTKATVKNASRRA